MPIVDVRFPFAGLLASDAEGRPVDIEVGECSICGALVRALGTPERKHAEFHDPTRKAQR